MPAPRPSPTLWTATAAVLGLLAPYPALTQAVSGGVLDTTHRQVISGKVLDATSGDPIEAMDVLVRNVRGEEAGRTLSDQDGRFFFVVENPGLYRLSVARFGYDSTATAKVAVAADQDLYLELEVQPEAVGLDPIRVTAPRTVPYLEGTGFYSRMRRGHGTFFSPRDLERMPGAFPSQC